MYTMGYGRFSLRPGNQIPILGETVVSSTTRGGVKYLTMNWNVAPWVKTMTVLPLGMGIVDRVLC